MSEFSHDRQIKAVADVASVPRYSLPLRRNNTSMLGRISGTIGGILFLALLSLGCGGNEPATPEQRKELTAVAETATVHLKESKSFARLAAPQIPSLAESKADLYVASENELRLVGKDIVATIQGDKAEVLFTLSVKKDSATRESRDALVRLVREGGKWRGDGAYVVAGK